MSLIKKLYKTYFVTWGATGQYFQAPFVYQSPVHIIGLGSKEKIKLIF